MNLAMVGRQQISCAWFKILEPNDLLAMTNTLKKDAEEYGYSKTDWHHWRSTNQGGDNKLE